LSTRYPDGRGGSYGNIIDLSNNGGGHSHTRGKIAVGHISGQAPLRQRQQVIFQFIAPSSGLDLHCTDCVSEVTLLLGTPPCVEATYAVRHGDECPRLAPAAGG
jgi:hypothetical protein